MSFQLSSSSTLSFGAAEDNAPPSFNLAPFVDIVLQLICFYIFVGGAVQRYSDPDVLLPRVTHPQATDRQPSELVVNVKSDGTLIVNDRPIARADLGPMLRDRRQKQEADPDIPVVRVTIRVDRRQNFGVLEDVLAACREAGLAHILLATMEEREP